MLIDLHLTVSNKEHLVPVLALHHHDQPRVGHRRRELRRDQREDLATTGVFSERAERRDVGEQGDIKRLQQRVPVRSKDRSVWLFGLILCVAVLSVSRQKLAVER